MLPVQGLDREFFARLEEVDAQIARAVAAGRCRHCGGPLHRADYQRKPRGGIVAADGEASTLRHSLCCGRRGCRRRALPPSLRFLGRRVYLEVVVALAVVFVQTVAGAACAAVSATRVPARTIQRWELWWREGFARTPTWAQLRARFMPPPPNEEALPRSLVARLGADLGEPLGPAVMRLMARLLAPATTRSVFDCARFVREATVEA
jgi:hypothetical protein